MTMRKINYRPGERTPYFASIYDHDAKSPLHSATKEEIIKAARELARLAEWLDFTDKASLVAADIENEVWDHIRDVRMSVIGVSLAIGLPVGGELTTSGIGIPV
jgi:hypothetical protein